jgi:hypothetical protein
VLLLLLWLLLLLLLLLLLQVKELLQANKPVRDAEWTAKEVSSCTTRPPPPHF